VRAAVIGVQAADHALNALLDRVFGACAAVGAQHKEVEALDAAGSAKEAYYAQAKSALQDVDYTEVISRFSQQQNTLDVAMKSFKLLSQLSLLSVL
jgi:flagellar hook-associated protein 3 FlgL